MYQANAEIDENGYFVRNTVSGRYREETSQFDKSQIDLMDVSPKMVFSVATSMIPFLQNDDCTRALMGSNMQRQAVPLLNDPTCFLQEFFICDLDHEALIRILMVHIDPGDLCGIFFYFAVCAAENRCGSNFQILFVTYRNLLQI